MLSLKPQLSRRDRSGVIVGRSGRFRVLLASVFSLILRRRGRRDGFGSGVRLIYLFGRRSSLAQTICRYVEIRFSDPSTLRPQLVSPTAAAGQSHGILTAPSGTLEKSGSTLTGLQVSASHSQGERIREVQRSELTRLDRLVATRIEIHNWQRIDVGRPANDIAGHGGPWPKVSSRSESKTLSGMSAPGEFSTALFAGRLEEVRNFAGNQTPGKFGRSFHMQTVQRVHGAGQEQGLPVVYAHGSRIAAAGGIANVSGLAVRPGALLSVARPRLQANETPPDRLSVVSHDPASPTRAQIGGFTRVTEKVESAAGQNILLHAERPRFRMRAKWFVEARAISSAGSNLASEMLREQTAGSSARVAPINFSSLKLAVPARSSRSQGMLYSPRQSQPEVTARLNQNLMEAPVATTLSPLNPRAMVRPVSRKNRSYSSRLIGGRTADGTRVDVAGRSSVPLDVLPAEMPLQDFTLRAQRVIAEAQFSPEHAADFAINEKTTADSSGARSMVGDERSPMSALAGNIAVGKSARPSLAAQSPREMVSRAGRIGVAKRLHWNPASEVMRPDPYPAKQVMGSVQLRRRMTGGVQMGIVNSRGTLVAISETKEFTQPENPASCTAAPGSGIKDSQPQRSTSGIRPPRLEHIKRSPALAWRPGSSQSSLDEITQTSETAATPSRIGYNWQNQTSRETGGAAFMAPHQFQAMSQRVYELIVDRVRKEKERNGR